MRSDRFEWDDEKAAINKRNHDVAFEDATRVFADASALDEIDTGMEYGEERSFITGSSGSEPLVVVYTMRGERIRIISARRASRHDRKRYVDQGGRAGR